MGDDIHTDDVQLTGSVGIVPSPPTLLVTSRSTDQGTPFLATCS